MPNSQSELQKSNSKKTNKFPFNPGRCPIFYGWIILIASAVGTIASLPGQTFGVSAFTEPLLNALPVNRTPLSLAYTIGTIGSALMLTWGGKMYDRLGARVTGVIAAASLGLTLVYLSKIDLISAGIANFIKIDETHAWTAFAMLALGFMMLRFWGQGILTMVSRNMLMKWFDHRRGLANGIIGLIIPVVFSMTPLLFDQLVEGVGWSQSWIYMAFAMIGVAIFIASFFRDNPEDCGMLPDGGLKARPGDPQHDPPREYTLPEARRTMAFWVYTLTIAMHALYITAFSFHVVSIFNDAGIDKAKAMAIFIPSSVITVAIAFVAGWLSDHLPLKYFLFILMLGMGTSMTGILMLDQSLGYYMAIAGNGIAGGTFGLLMSVTWPRFYGRKHLGAISGFHMTWVVAFSAIGPTLFGLGFAWRHTYQAPTAICITALAILFILAVKMREPDMNT